MKLSIRLQNHGCANHPYWWIVVAPNRKNIRGRFVEHVGYWSPRHGTSLQRQIIFNIPRIKHWISCGAVPTFKVQKFLSIWGILPKPWFFKKTEQQLAALKKPEAEMTEKEKMKQQRKRKRRERVKLSPLNYYKYQAKFKAAQYVHYHRYRNNLREKIQAAERENQILRELIVHNEFYKINRINELSGNIVYDDTQQLKRLQGELSKAKSELALIDKNIKNSSTVQKIKVMRQINNLVDKIRSVQREREPFRKKTVQIAHEGQNVSQYQIDKKLEYELILKKIDKMNEQFIHIQSLLDPVTLQEYANYLQSKDQDLEDQQALAQAQTYFIERSQLGLKGLTKYDLYFQDEIASQGETYQQYQKHPERAPQHLRKQHEILSKVQDKDLINYMMTREGVIVPTNRPVHPFPDINTYIPEEYYQPIVHINLNMANIASLEPKDQLDKYHQKRNYQQNGDKKPIKVVKSPQKDKKSARRVDHVV